MRLFILSYYLEALVIFSAFGQNKEYNTNKFLRIVSENDNYVAFHDRYFTNGLGLELSISKDRVQSNKSKFLHFRLTQEIYTPDDIKKDNVEEFDRPYAGYLYLHSAVSTFWKKRNNLYFAVNTGIIGPGAGGSIVQTWWHKFIGFTEPRGWKFQLENQPVLNIYAEYTRSWQLLNRTELTTASILETGTSFNNVSQELLVRFGKYNSIDQSVLKNSWFRNHDPQKEWFRFISVKTKAVLHNALIEGSLFNGDPTLPGFNAKSFLINQKLGLAYSSSATNLKLVFFRISPEVLNNAAHYYVQINLSFRV